MINILLENLISLKYTTPISMTCDVCGKQYTKTKSQLYQNNRQLYTIEGFTKKTSCSKECQNILQHKRITRECKRCKTIFECLISDDKIYCSHMCSNLDRVHTEETKLKISKSLKEYATSHVKPKSPIKCVICNTQIIPIGKRFRKKICSIECKKQALILAGKKGGRISASKMTKRSKAEIKLYELLSTKYQCISNKPMFNGWDADIIIPELKLAILWNGIWHYSKVRQSHSVNQVQNRDWIKINEIEKCGYNYIIVKDYKNKMTPVKAFSLIENCISLNNYNLSLI